MDLRAYYQKIRDTEAEITEAFPMVVSLATADGGKEGVLTEVTRRNRRQDDGGRVGATGDRRGSGRSGRRRRRRSEWRTRRRRRPRCS